VPRLHTPRWPWPSGHRARWTPPARPSPGAASANPWPRTHWSVNSRTSIPVPAVTSCVACWRCARAVFADGAEAFGQGLEEDPDNLAARISHARALYLAGKRAAAREQLEIVVAKRPDEALANFLLGLLLESGGETTAARQAYQRSLTAQPEHPGASHHLGPACLPRWRMAACGRSARTGSGRDSPTTSRHGFWRWWRKPALGGELGGRSRRILETLVAERSGPPLPRYALSRLRSAAEDPAVRDPVRGLAIGRGPAAERPDPARLRGTGTGAGRQRQSGSCAQAALEDAETAYRRSGASIFLPRLQAQRERLAAGGLPAEAWPEDDPVLVPPPPDPRGVFQEYPTPRPF
jgi:protein O-mannosyl-transferase